MIAGWLEQQSPKFFRGELPLTFVSLTATATERAGDRIVTGDVLDIAVDSQPAEGEHITRWYPDTCECVLEYNDEFQLKRVVQVCRRHAHLSGKALLQEALKENRGKNR